jgi:hypothetical protein
MAHDMFARLVSLTADKKNPEVYNLTYAVNDEQYSLKLVMGEEELEVEPQGALEKYFELLEAAEDRELSTEEEKQAEIAMIGDWMVETLVNSGMLGITSDELFSDEEEEEEE